VDSQPFCSPDAPRLRLWRPRVRRRPTVRPQPDVYVAQGICEPTVVRPVCTGVCVTCVISVTRTRQPVQCDAK